MGGSRLVQQRDWHLSGGHTPLPSSDTARLSPCGTCHAPRRSQTLRFWTRSSLRGPFAVSLRSSGGPTTLPVRVTRRRHPVVRYRDPASAAPQPDTAPRAAAQCAGSWSAITPLYRGSSGGKPDRDGSGGGGGGDNGARAALAVAEAAAAAAAGRGRRPPTGRRRSDIQKHCPVSHGSSVGGSCPLCVIFAPTSSAPQTVPAERPVCRRQRRLEQLP